MEELLPEASFKSKGLCSTNIAKQKVDAFRGDSSSGFIQIAKVLKNEVPDLRNQLLIDIISMYNYFAHYNIGICKSTNEIVTICFAIKDDSRINFYYDDDGIYLYLYMTHVNNYIVRKILSAPRVNDDIGSITKVESINTEKIITKN